MQTARDTYNQIEYAKKKGREEGRVEGHEEGMLAGIEKGRREVAMNLLRLKLPVPAISEATGLAEEEVSGLKET